MLKKLLWPTISLVLFLFNQGYSAVVEIPKDAETIQEGIDLASDADTVLVDPGIYVENLDFSGREIVIHAYGDPGTTILMPSDPSSSTVTIQNGEGSGARLVGFTVTGGLTDHVIFIDSGATPIIEDNIFHNNLDPGIFDKAVIACWSDSSYVIIRRNIFYDNGGITSVWIQKGKGDIINNTFAYNNAVMMCNTGLAVVYNNIISYSTYTAVDGTWADFDYNDLYENNGDFG